VSTRAVRICISICSLPFLATGVARNHAVVMASPDGVEFVSTRDSEWLASVNLAIAQKQWEKIEQLWQGRIQQPVDQTGTNYQYVISLAKALRAIRAGNVELGKRCSDQMIAKLDNDTALTAMGIMALRWQSQHDVANRVTLPTVLDDDIAARLGSLATTEYWDTKRRLARNSRADQDVVLSEVRSQITGRTEVAIQATKSPLLDAFVLGQWWSMMADRDVPITWGRLKDSIPRRIDEAQGRLLAEQAVKLETSLNNALAAGRDGQQFAPETRKLLAKAIAGEFRQLAPAPIEPVSFDKLQRDVSLFCDVGLPIQVGREQKPNSNTFRWYVWLAMTQLAPSGMERAIIDEQIQTLCGITEDACNKEFKSPDYDPKKSAELVRQFREFYDRTKDNCWFPYFKRAWTAVEFDVLCDEMRNSIAELGKQLRDGLAEGGARPRAEDHKAYLSYEAAILQTVQFSIRRLSTERSNPSNLALPTERVMSGGGRMNSAGIYVFSVDRIKQISPDN
jgi:hypothetical protein